MAGVSDVPGAAPPLDLQLTFGSAFGIWSTTLVLMALTYESVRAMRLQPMFQQGGPLSSSRPGTTMLTTSLAEVSKWRSMPLLLSWTGSVTKKPSVGTNGSSLCAPTGQLIRSLSLKSSQSRCRDCLCSGSLRRTLCTLSCRTCCRKGIAGWSAVFAGVPLRSVLEEPPCALSLHQLARGALTSVWVIGMSSFAQGGCFGAGGVAAIPAGEIFAGKGWEVAAAAQHRAVSGLSSTG